MIRNQRNFWQSFKKPEGPRDFHNHILLFVCLMILFLVLDWIRGDENLNNAQARGYHNEYVPENK